MDMSSRRSSASVSSVHGCVASSCSSRGVRHRSRCRSLGGASLQLCIVPSEHGIRKWTNPETWPFLVILWPTISKAQYSLGGLYYEGKAGIQIDDAEAFKWFKRAADFGWIAAVAGDPFSSSSSSSFSENQLLMKSILALALATLATLATPATPATPATHILYVSTCDRGWRSSCRSLQRSSSSLRPSSLESSRRAHHAGPGGGGAHTV